MAYDDDYFNFLTWSEMDRIFQVFGGVSEELTLGNIRTIIHSFVPRGTRRESLSGLGLADVERTLEQHGLAALSVGSLTRIIESLQSMAIYEDTFERLTLDQVDSLLATAGIERIAIADLKAFVDAALRSAGEYADAYETLRMTDIEKLLNRLGLNRLPIGAIRSLISVQRRAQYADFGGFRLRAAYADFNSFTLAELLRGFALHGTDALSFAALRGLAAQARSFALSGYEDIFDRFTAGDLQRAISRDELEKVTLGELSSILERMSVIGSYQDTFEQMTLSEFDQKVTAAGLNALLVSDLDALAREFGSTTAYPDTFESLEWRQLNRAIESKRLGAISVGDVSRLFTVLQPLSAHEDVFETLTVSDLRKLTTTGLNQFSVADVFALIDLAAKQSAYQDVFESLGLTELIQRISSVGLKPMSLGQLRQLLDKLRPLVQKNVVSGTLPSHSKKSGSRQ